MIKGNIFSWPLFLCLIAIALSCAKPSDGGTHDDSEGKGEIEVKVKMDNKYSQKYGMKNKKVYLFLRKSSDNKANFERQESVIAPTESEVSVFMKDIIADEYYIHVMLDWDGSGMNIETGDFFNQDVKKVRIASGMNQTDAVIDNRAEGDYSISGVLTRPGGHPDPVGKQWYVIMDKDTDPGNGYSLIDSGYWTTGSTQAYTISGVWGGNFYISAGVDIDGNGGPPNTGDYIRPQETISVSMSTSWSRTLTTVP